MLFHTLTIRRVSNLSGVRTDELNMMPHNCAIFITLQIRRYFRDDFQQSHHDIGVTGAIDANLIKGGARQMTRSAAGAR